MSLSILKSQGVDIMLWAQLNEVESQALDQLKNIASLPWVFHHVAVMPDVHLGKGATVGSVIAMNGAVSPAAVGVDIGCGMGAVRTSVKASQLGDNLKDLRERIERVIPVGHNQHEESVFPRIRKISQVATRLWMDVGELEGQFKDLHPKVQDLHSKAMRQLGTLGGGNHFIELCLDTEENVWLMLHSGSRNIGKTLAEIHMEIAKKLIHNQELPDKDLAVFLSKTPEMEAYRRDLFWAQRYAFANRRAMFELYKQQFKFLFKNAEFEEPILCHHNYVSEETHFGENVVVTRKGAISAKKGELGIIPGSMGTRSFIVRGLGNEESFHSASHGAGRRMSRNQAKKKFTLDDLVKQTAGVECRKDSGVIDEIPAAYKDIDEVMRNQSDLVEVVATLKQVLCVKG